MTTDLTVEIDDHVAVLEIHRPPANFLDHELIRLIADTATALADDGTTRAIVLCSEGRHFCAGADLGSDLFGATRTETARALYTEAVRLFRVQLPVVAAVQGSAVGGGLGLACAADFRVASHSTRFHANFAALGFHQGFGLSVTLPRIVGHQVAADLLLTARRMDGTEARAVGLVDRLVEGSDVRAAAVDLARSLAASAPLAVRSIRETMRSGLADEVRHVLDRELAEQARLWLTDDSAEGVAANLARRPPEFLGR